MSDRLFRLLPWAPCLLVLLSGGVQQIVVLWLLPSALVLFHLAWNDSLSDLERRQWRRELLVGGWGVALIYLCAEDRHLPIHPAEAVPETETRTEPRS